MPKLKTLSGTDLIKIFFLFGFEVSSQRGSHIKLVRLNNGQKQILTIPNHKELDKGTIKAIFRQASKFVSEDSLYTHFYFL